ncbi:hypothetical protein [Micromonospora sp. NPDC051296]|uniref:hypothetical protein n=1 Tax=Micromonospora sp. NPDC051296 TaxID=3155046 RepID=UPI0034373067
MQAGRHLEAGGGGADGRHLNGRRRGGRQAGDRRHGLLGGWSGTLRRHDEPIAAGVVARLTQPGRGAHRGLSAGHRLVRVGHAVHVVHAVDVMAVDPGRLLGLTCRRGQICVA